MKLPVRWSSSWLILAASVVFGCIGVYAASHYISRTVQAEKDRLNPNVRTLDVVVAKADLERGAIVGTDNMAVRKVPAEFVPGTAITPGYFGNVEGARLAVPMRSGEILLRGTLEGADTATFATKIASGVRAITLSVDEVNAMAGLLQPNDRVDLYYTAKPARAGASELTALLMQKVLILATGRQVRPSVADSDQPGVPRAFSTITIEATPEQAQRLILAQKSGTLTAVLRAPADSQPIVATAMDASTLLGGQKVRAARGRGLTTEIIIGGRGHLERELLAVAGATGSEGARTAAAPAAAPSQAANPSNTAAVVQDLIKAATPPMEARSLPR
jgi:pilus assembly protein CpaB